MTLADLYKSLALGELSNLALAVNGDITDAKKPTIVLHANDALKRLHTRFPLKTDTLFIEQRGHLTLYNLKKKYAQSQYQAGAGHSFYINDLGRVFNDDVLKVMEVNDQWGNKLPLNQPDRLLSVFTPQPTLLQIPNPMEGVPMAVMYQASHPKIQDDPDTQELELPDFLHSALTAFIAYKVFSQMNTQENTAKAAEHLKTFDMICVEAVEQDLITTGGTTGGIRFDRNGWV